MSTREEYDIVAIGSGPAGQKAAICGAKAGKRVLVVEQELGVGGACVRHGTIPSKTLRETALALSSFRRKSANALTVEAPQHQLVHALMSRVDHVVSAHERFMARQLARNGVIVERGRARLLSPTAVTIRTQRGAVREVEAKTIVLATGSRPRTPPEVAVDHEHVLDSDSILSMRYLPKTLAVLGSGVIACEYASIFSELGVAVTLVDKAAYPLGFLDPELVQPFVAGLVNGGGRFVSGRCARAVEFDGVDTVRLELDDGSTMEAEKVLCALGRVANVEGLGLEAAGVTLGARGFIEVDEHCRTAAPTVYAVGDVIGPPALAASAMEQGRRAVRHALGLSTQPWTELIPSGVYCIPEMASIGLTEARARELQGRVVVGRAHFSEIARGQIAAIDNGLLKLVATHDGRRILGVHIVGEGASELLGIGQIAMQVGWSAEQFVETIFNFPTLAEAYRVAALDILSQLGRRERGRVTTLPPAPRPAERGSQAPAS
ncbi:MAG: Si-specific NAD(P)(+) transhydrogenase [Polyangiaceae bacterium]